MQESFELEIKRRVSSLNPAEIENIQAKVNRLVNNNVNVL